MNNNTVSVVVATFNGALYIEEQLRSILAQTIPPDQVVITDDCSNDGTVALAKAQLDEAGIEYLVSINEHRLGYAQNFSAGLMLATGDYIFLSDQDDYWYPRKIKACLQFLVDGVDLVLHDMTVGDDRLNVLAESYLSLLGNGQGAEVGYCSGCAMAVRKSLVNLMLPIPVSVIDHDVWINEGARLLGRRCLYHDPLSIYRRHSSNTTSNYRLNKSVLKRVRGFIEAERSGYFYFRKLSINTELLDIHRRINFNANHERADELRREVIIYQARLTMKNKPLIMRIMEFKNYLRLDIGFLKYCKDVIFGLGYRRDHIYD